MSVIVSLMGGLGFFLYGMKLMSEGLHRFFYTSFLSILPHSHTFAKVHGKYLQTLSGKFSQNQSIVTLLGHADTPLIDKKKKRTVF